MGKAYEWRKKRTIAQAILTILIPEDLNHNFRGALHMLDAQGRLVNIGGTSTHKDFKYPELALSAIQYQLSRYNEKEINAATSLLAVNKHITIKKKENDKEIYLTALPIGHYAYEELHYINQKKENWHKDITNTSNWLTPIMTLLVAVLALILSLPQCKNTPLANTNISDSTSVTNKK